MLDGEVVDVSVRPRTEAVELVQAVNEQEKEINRRSGFHIGGEAAPEFRLSRPFEPKNKHEKQPGRNQVEAGGEPRNQIQSQGRRTDQQRAPTPAVQPFVLEEESRQRQQKDVVVLHQILGVVQMGGAKQQRENSGDRLRYIEPKADEQTETYQRRQHADQDADCVGDENIPDRGIGAGVVIEDRQPFQKGADDIQRQQQQRLTESVPVVESAAAPVHSELGIFAGENGGLGCPEGMRRLQPVHGVGRT